MTLRKQEHNRTLTLGARPAGVHIEYTIRAVCLSQTTSAQKTYSRMLKYPSITRGRVRGAYRILGSNFGDH